MRIIFNLAIAASLLLASCSNHVDSDVIGDTKLELTNVSFSIETRFEGSVVNSSPQRAMSKSAANYKRANAPVYVSGVEITAKYQDGVDNIIKGNFDFIDFGEDGGEDINMNIPLGSNKFDVISKSTHKAENKVYEGNIDKTSITDKARRIAYYSEELIKKQGIYAKFTGSKTKIITELSHDVNIDMVTTNARYGIVLETSPNYEARMVVSYTGVNSFNVVNRSSDKVSALILNSEDFIGEKTLTITVGVYRIGENEVLKQYIITDSMGNNYKSAAAVNKVLVLSVNASGELIRQETGITFSWTPMSNEGDIKEIN